MGLLTSKPKAEVSVSRTSIGGYQVIERIGKGATGAVYKARQPGTGKFVALKLIASEVAGDSVQRLRFAQECQVTRRLNHPNVVRVLDFGMDGDKAYMVMEYVDGESLGARLDRVAKLPEFEALGLIKQIGQGLHAAHKRRLIHRDIKPDNVLVTADGQAKLADLGLAKNLEGDFELTQTKSCLGTLNFMAPEQFEDARKADVRSDMYSLAATLYMMVTGELPFRARSSSALAAVYRKQKTNDIIPPRQAAPTLSPHVEAAILRGMRADPKERFESVEEFLKALEPPRAEKKRGPNAHARPTLTSSSGSGSEHRIKKRYPCARKTACRALEWSAGENWTGEVVNISETGLCLQLSRRFEPGSILTVVLNGQTSQRRSVLVRIVWVEQVTKRLWRMGCQYDQPLCDFEVQEMSAAEDGGIAPLASAHEPDPDLAAYGVGE
jgi:serine/threonine protein kinase